MANQITIKMGSTVPSSTNLTLGELGLKTDTKKLYIGDGSATSRIAMHNDYAANSFQYATVIGTPTSKTRAEVLSLLSGQANVDFSFNSKKITSIANPLNPQDAASKSYVDALVTSGINWMDKVLDKDILTPPASPVTGDRYWIGGTGTGAWSSEDYNVAEWNGTTWDFTIVGEGDAAYVDDENLFYFYDGTVLKKFASAMGPHATTHENNGTDEINVIGLNGLLADRQTPIFHALQHVTGGDDKIRDASVSLDGIVNIGTQTFGGVKTFAQFPITPPGNPITDYQVANKQYVDNKITTKDTFIELNDTPISYQTAALQFLRVNSYESQIEFVASSAYFEDVPTDGELGKGPTSNWAYDHTATNTGVHGAGSNFLLNSGSIINGGTW